MPGSGRYSSVPSGERSPVYTSDKEKSFILPRTASASPPPLRWQPPVQQSRPASLLRRCAIVLVVLAVIALLKDSMSVLRSRDFKLTRNDVRAMIYGAPPTEPYARHPIQVLMDEARSQWDEKISSQSTSLDEAKDEYRRRYRREVPRGFDVWYEWAIVNGVQLIDEYDSITDMISPFLSLSPAELEARIKGMSDEHGSHAILEVRDGVQQPWRGATWRKPVLDDWDDYVVNIARMLPNITLPIHLHDGPALYLSWEDRQAHNDAAAHGEVLEETVKANGSWHNWEEMCAPDSRIRRVTRGLEAPGDWQPHAFTTTDHATAMSICANPEFRIMHGTTSAGGWLSDLSPSFAMSRTDLNGDIGFPPTIHYDLNPPNEVSFKDKPVHKLVWRGRIDGIAADVHHEWRESHRFRLASLLNEKGNDAKRTVRVGRHDLMGREYFEDVEVGLGELNERYADVKATGVVQCDSVVCETTKQEIEFGNYASLEEMSQARYVMDVDGNAYSARFRAHLESFQVPLKSTIYKEWYHDRIMPWLHYVPVRQDYSDIYDILAFFDGFGPDREGHHDDLAEEIALAGREWALTHLRRVDMTAYVFRLLLEYGRLFEEEREPLLATTH